MHEKSMKSKKIAKITGGINIFLVFIVFYMFFVFSFYLMQWTFILVIRERFKLNYSRPSRAPPPPRLTMESR